MKKFIKILKLSVLFILLFFITSCKENKEDPNKKYDIAIKVKNNYESTWIFTPDVSEITYTFEYTGEKMYFYFDSYNITNHASLSIYWIAPSSGKKSSYFSVNLMNKNQIYGEKHPEYVCEKGEYCFSVTASPGSANWKFRSVYLYITVI